MRRGLCVALEIAGLATCLATLSDAQSVRDKELVVVTDMDAGRTVRIAAGATLVARLASNPMTGYQWRDSGSGGIYLQPVGKSRYEQVKRAALGAGGTQVFIYKAIRPGKVQLRLQYLRPWGKIAVRRNSGIQSASAGSPRR